MIGIDLFAPDCAAHHLIWTPHPDIQKPGPRLRFQSQFRPGFLILVMDEVRTRSRAVSSVRGCPPVKFIEFISNGRFHQLIPELRQNIFGKASCGGRCAHIGNHFCLARLVPHGRSAVLDAGGGIHIAKAQGKQINKPPVHIVNARTNIDHGGAILGKPHPGFSIGVYHGAALKPWAQICRAPHIYAYEDR